MCFVDVHTDDSCDCISDFQMEVEQGKVCEIINDCELECV